MTNKYLWFLAIEGKFKAYGFISERNYEFFEEFIRYLQTDNNVGETGYTSTSRDSRLSSESLDVNLDEAEKDDFKFYLKT